jgi:hypothetical protein
MPLLWDLLAHQLRLSAGAPVLRKLPRATAQAFWQGVLLPRASQSFGRAFDLAKQVDQWDFSHKDYPLQEFAQLSVSIHPGSSSSFLFVDQPKAPRFIKKFPWTVPHRPTVSKDVVHDGHGQHSSMIFWESQTFTTSSWFIMVIICYY